MDRIELRPGTTIWEHPLWKRLGDKAWELLLEPCRCKVCRECWRIKGHKKVCIFKCPASFKEVRP